MSMKCNICTAIAMVMGLSAIALLSTSVQADVVHNDDVIVDSLCTSDDSTCANGESFNPPTALVSVELKIKDNAPNIWFNNTLAGNEDWVIDTGGGDFGIFSESSGGDILFIEDGAGANLLYLDAAEHIGVNTSAPSHSMHVVGDRIRLQNGSKNLYMRADGFALDLQAEGQDLFLRSATAGQNIVINPFVNDGFVAIGHTVPETILHVKSESPELRVESSSATPSEKELIKLINNGGVNFKLEDTTGSGNPSGNGEWTFRTGTSGTKFVIGKTGTSVQEFQVFSGGNARVAGTLTQGSSRTKKENFVEIHAQEILAKVLELPISEWNYIHDDDTTRHIGPMAEDFHQLFQVGNGPKTISSLDTSGIAFAAIQALKQQQDARDHEVQALKQQVKEKDAKIAELEQRLASVETDHARVVALEHAVQSLMAQQQNTITTAAFTQ